MKTKTLKIAVIVQLIILALAFILVGLCFQVNTSFAYADSENKLYIKNTEFDARRGEEFSTIIFVPENSELSNLDLTLRYDDEKLSLVSCELLNASQQRVTGNIIKIAFASDQDILEQLNLIELTFFVKDENLANGTYYDWLVWEHATTDEAVARFTDDLEIVTDFDPLFIRKSGDAYNNRYDGLVNSRDAAYILRSIVDDNITLSEIDKKYANVHENYKDDGSPKINSRDAAMILRYTVEADDEDGFRLDDRKNVVFMVPDDDGNYIPYLEKSVVEGNGIINVPNVPNYELYENGVWSTIKVATTEEAITPDFDNIQKDSVVYAVYNYTGKTKESLLLYNQVVSAIDNVFMEEGKYIADDFQLPYKNANAVYNMPSYSDYDVTWKVNSGLLAQGISINNYVVTVPEIDYTTWVTFTATIIIDKIEYGTISFDREIKGTIDLPDSTEFEKIVNNVPKVIEEDYRLPGYVSLESGRLNYGVSVVQNVDIKWSLINGDEKGYDSQKYGFKYLRDENEVMLKADFIFDEKVVASFPLERTIPAKSLEDQKAYAERYISSFVPSILSTTYLFPTSVELYDFSVTWYSTSSSGKFDFSQGIETYNGMQYQLIGLGNKAGYLETAYLTARIERDGQKIGEVTFPVQLAGESDEVDRNKIPDEKLYNALLSIFAVDDGEGGKKLTEESLTGYLKGDTTEFINVSAVENFRNNHSLDLSGKGIKNLKGIEYLTSVRVLNLSNNDLSVADTSGLEYLASLTKLEQLELSNCGIFEMPKGILLNMFNIEGIDVSHNNLTNLNFIDVDRPLTSLTDLFAHDNDLIDISGLAYDRGTDKDGKTVFESTIPNVRRLTLSRNEDNDDLASLDITPIGYAENLVVLWLANQNISDISALANCKYLETLDLSNNNIVAQNINNDGLLPLVNLTNLGKLVLDNNKITSVRSLRKLTNLKFLSLSYNSINNLGSSLSRLNNIIVLNLNNNNLTSFDCSSFPYLSYLYLENNQLMQVENISAVAPVIGTEGSDKYGLIVLRLSGNHIDYDVVEENEKTIPQIAQLTNLEYLTLSDNKVEKLDFLENLTSLTHLEIENTSLLQVYDVDDYQDPETGEYVQKHINNISYLYGLTQLKVLDISYNPLITDISGLADAVGGAKSLEYLYVNKNFEDPAITNVLSLRRMSYLKGLSLQYSGLQDFSFIQQLGSIEYLNLAGTSIETINFINFSGKDELKELYLDSAVGSSVANLESLQDLVELKALSLANLLIDSVDDLPDWEKIEYLNLSGTDITDFAGSDEDFSSIARFKESIRILDVGNNENVFTKQNLNLLYDNFNKDSVTVYLYGDKSKVGFDGDREAEYIHKFFTEIPEKQYQIHEFYENNFDLQSVVNGYNVGWTTDNEWFKVENNTLSVYNWLMETEDNVIVLNAEFDVYLKDGAINAITFNDTAIDSSPYKIIKYTDAITDSSVVSAHEDETHFFNVTLKDDSHADMTVASRYGYTFDYWFTEKFGGGDRIDENYSQASIENKVVYAKWLYRVDYKENGGSLNDVDHQIYVSNQGVLFPANIPSKSGYYFDYWYLDDGVTPDEDLKPFAEGTVFHNVELTAKWYYEIVYDANNGQLKDVATQKYDEFEEIILPKLATRNNYHFNGWFSDSMKRNIKDGDVLHNMEVAAQWCYIVTYDADGGSLNDVDSQNYDEGFGVILPAEPSRAGYHFDGWYNGDEKISDGKVFDGDVILQAKWHYEVSYDPDGGNMTETRDSFDSRAAFVITDNEPSKDGYTFDGWLLNNQKVETGFVSEIGDINLTAKWVAVPVYLELYDGDTLINNTIFAEYASEYNLNGLSNALSTYNKVGYVFRNWYYDHDYMQVCPNTIKLDNDNVYDVNDRLILRLYAVWDVDPYTIGQYVPNGSIVSSTDGICTYTVYNTIDSTPWSTSGRVIIDWSMESDTNLLNHTNRSVSGNRYNNIDIGNTTTEIIFIGSAEKTFTNFRMYICAFANNQKLTIRFKDFNFVTNESTAIGLYSDNGANVTIDVLGSCSITTSYAGGNIIGLSDEAIKTLTFTGDGVMSITAGDGADATVAGGNGGDGGVAIYVDNFTIDMTGSITAKGGNGGNGAKGKDQSLETKDSNPPATTTTNGGNGGNGGNAVQCTKLTVSDAYKVSFVGGNGGKGGNGGSAGDGYGGFQNEIGALNAGSYSGYADLPDGANGGDGGNGGAPINQNALISISKKTELRLQYGDGGNGGNGGQGGDAGWPDNGVNPDGKGHGGNAGKGGNGYIGGNSGVGGNGGSSFTNFTSGWFGAKNDQIGTTGDGGYGNSGGNAIATIIYKNGNKTIEYGSVGSGGRGGYCGSQSGASNGKSVNYGTDRSGSVGANGTQVASDYNVTWVS